MKKIYRNALKSSRLIALVLFSGLGLVACQNNDNDIYEDDPIVRLEKARQEMKNHLVNESPNGWMVTFRPDGGKQLGEFNMWFKFKDTYDVEIKSDFNTNDLAIEKSEYNFTMLRTFALSFPVFNKVHEFTQGIYKDEEDKDQIYSNRSDIEFMFNQYLANGDVETVGFMSNQKVVFRKATTEDLDFRFDDEWAVYEKLDSMKRVQLVQDGVSKNLNFEAIKLHRAAYIGKITKRPDGRKTISETLTDTGAVTFGVNSSGEVELVPALELDNGLTINKLIMIGSSFYGEADANNSILIRP
ncbi:DUF4302 domain-containing protein [Myroides odoratus]